MKKMLVLVSLIFVIGGAKSQVCSNVPVLETVDNGDFEKGYLKNNGSEYADGTVRKFKSDLAYGGDFTSTMGCAYNFGDKFGVAKFESKPCNNGANNVPYGVGYINGSSWKDHTKGTSAGYGLIVDFFSCSGVDGNSKLYAGGEPIAWAQDVNVISNQVYYFSAWFAQYTVTPASGLNMFFVVIPKDANGNLLLAQRQVIGTVSPSTQTMNWEQFYGTWNSGSYTKALITIEMDASNPNDCSTAGDFAIDDISFINGCTSLETTIIKPELGPDFSICTTSGTVTLNSNLTTDGVRQFYWYEVNGTTSTELVNGSTTTNTLTINKPGTYSVCIADAKNKACGARSDVVVSDEFVLTLTGNDLCTPATSTFKATIKPTGTYTYDWTVPSGVTDPGNVTTFTSSTVGTYAVKVNGPSGVGWNCEKTASKTITSSLPQVPTNLDYCDGGLTATTLSMPDGKNYTWYKDKNKTPLTGTVVGNGTSSVTWTPANGTTGDQTLYVVSADKTPLAGSLGPAFNGTSYPDGTGTSISMTVSQSVELTSLSLYSTTWVGSCQGVGTTTTIPITLKNGNTVVSTKNVTINCGSFTLNAPFNLIIPPGTYTLEGPGTLSAANMSGTQTNTAVSISGTKTIFASLKFAITSACDPIPVVVKSKVCCVKPTIDPLINSTASVLQICPGGNYTIVSQALAANVDYKWQKETATAGVFSDIVGATGSVLNGNTVSLSTGLTAGKYRLVIANASNLSTTCVKTVDVTLVQNTKPANPIVGNAISLCQGDAVTPLSATALAGHTLQWYGTDATGGTASTVVPVYSTSNAATNTYYVSQKNNTTSCESDRASIQVTVKVKPITPNITGLPALKLCVGTAFTLTPSSTTTGVTYSWITKPNGHSTTENASSKVLSSSSAIIADGGTYSVTATLNGCTSAAGSITLSINSLPVVSATSAPNSNNKYCEGATVTLKGSGATSYLWDNGVTDNVGFVANSNAFKTYTVVGTDANGCKNTATLTLSQLAATAIVTQPTVVVGCAGDSDKKLTVSAVGDNITYKWYKNNNTNSVLNTTNTLLLNPLDSSTHAGTYQVEVSGTCGNVLSTSVSVTVNKKPTIKTDLINASGCVSSNNALTVEANPNTLPLSYVWQKISGNGTGAINETSNVLSFSPLTSNSAGTYQVTVSNTCGDVKSTIATVSITENEVPSVVLSSDIAVLCEGNGIVLKAIGSGSGNLPTYSFYDNIDAQGDQLIGVLNQTSNQLALPSLTKGSHVFKVLMTSNSVCILNGSANPATSNLVTVQVDANPVTPVLDGIVSPKVTCTSSETLKVQPSVPQTAKGVWTIVTQPTGGNASISAATSEIATISNLATGLTSTRWTITNGVCPSKSVDLVLDKKGDITTPTILLNTVDMTDKTADLCINSNNTVVGATPNILNKEVGTWSKISGTSVDISNNVNNTSQSLTLTQAGTSVLKWEISSTIPGCTAQSRQITLVVHDLPVAEIMTVSSKDTCEGTDIQLTAKTLGATDQGVWSSNNTNVLFNTNTSLATSASNLPIGSSTITWTVDNPGCAPATDAEIILIEDMVQGFVTLNGALPLKSCVNVPIDVKVKVLDEKNNELTGVATWTISQGTKNNETSKSLTIKDITTPGLLNIDYKIKLDKRCVSNVNANHEISLVQQQVEIVKGPSPSILQNDTTICRSSGGFSLNGINTTAGNSFKWYMEGSNAAIGSGLNYTVTQSGTYYITETDPVCKAEVPSIKKVAIQIVEKPNVSIVEPYVVMRENESLHLHGIKSNNTSNIMWTMDQTDVPDVLDFEVDKLSAGIYTIFLTGTSTPCPMAKDSVIVKVRGTVKIPQVVTPNGNNENDNWGIIGLETYDAPHVTVFDKWGSIVFETLNYNVEKWYGQNQKTGKELPEGVYFYVIVPSSDEKENTVNPNSSPIAGHVTILR